MNLTILTNNLHIISIMERAKSFTVIIPGGIVDTDEGAIYGNSCERDILKYNIDLAILDITPILMDKGNTESGMKKSGIISAMSQAARKKAIITDCKKFNERFTTTVSGYFNIDYIFSGANLPDEMTKYFEQRHIQIITPK